MISEHDSQQTPPDSDTNNATTPEVTDDQTALDEPLEDTKTTKRSKPRAKFALDGGRLLRSTNGYKQLTPPQTPLLIIPSADRVDEEEEHKVAEDKRIERRKTEKKSKLNNDNNVINESNLYPRENFDIREILTTGRRRFVGIYPRHIVLLMFLCGLIGGMVGHWWTERGLACQTVHDLTEKYNQVVVENSKLTEQVRQQEKEDYLATSTLPPVSGHEDHDGWVAVEKLETDEEVHQKEVVKRFEAREDFESMVWDTLKRTGPVTDEQMQRHLDFKRKVLPEEELRLLNAKYPPKRMYRDTRKQDGGDNSGEKKYNNQKNSDKKYKEYKYNQEKRARKDGGGSDEDSREENYYKGKKNGGYNKQAHGDKRKESGGLKYQGNKKWERSSGGDWSGDRERLPKKMRDFDRMETTAAA